MKLESGQSGSIITYNGITPKIHPSVFLCEGVRIIGDVEIGEGSSVWYNTVIRGDVHYIRIGKRVNIQDLSMLHVTNGRFPLNIADDVSIGHSVSVHGCTIKENSLLGIGSIVLDGATVGRDCLVAAGCVVREGFEVPDRSLIAGVPGRIIRELSEEELKRVRSTSPHYVDYVETYRSESKKAGY